MKLTAQTPLTCHSTDVPKKDQGLPFCLPCTALPHFRTSPPQACKLEDKAHPAAACKQAAWPPWASQPVVGEGFRSTLHRSLRSGACLVPLLVFVLSGDGIHAKDSSVRNTHA